MEITCHGCGVDGLDLFRCKRCKLGLYCSKECQSKHWTEHQEVCRAFVASSTTTTIGHRFKIVKIEPVPAGEKNEQEIARQLEEETERANALFAARVLEFEQAAFPPPDQEEPTRIVGGDESEETFQMRLKSFQEYTLRLEETGWKNKLNAESGFLDNWFAQRYLHGLFTVYNQKYRDFRVLKDSFVRKKINALSAWANLKMDNPPPILDTDAKVKEVLFALRNKPTTDGSSPEVRQREEIEHFVNVEFRISQLMNEIAKVFNYGIRLNDLCDENGALLAYEQERIATYEKLRALKYPDSASLSGKEEEGDKESEQTKAILAELRQKDDARRAWFQRIVDRLKPIGELIALGDTKLDIVQLIDTFMEDPLEFSGRHQNIALFGEPGTGKTEVGVRLGPLFYALGFVQVDPGETFNALSRADFVSGILGQTVSKVRDVFLNNLGSFIFVDEAYAIHTDKEDSYGSEAVHEITNELQVYKGLISIAIAGYRNKIEKNLFAENPGLSSRFPEQWDFRTYSSPELYHIFSFLAARKGVNLGPSTRGRVKAGSAADPARVRQTLINLIALMNRNEYRMFKDANGRAMETILSWTIRFTSQEKLRLERDQNLESGDEEEGRKTPRKGATLGEDGTIVTITNVDDPKYLFMAFEKWASIPKDQQLPPQEDGQPQKQPQQLEKVLYDLRELEEGGDEEEEEEEDWDIPKDMTKGVKSRSFKPICPVPDPLAFVRPVRSGQVPSTGKEVDYASLLTDDHFADLERRFYGVLVIGDYNEGLVQQLANNELGPEEAVDLESILRQSIPNLEKLEQDMRNTLTAYRMALKQERANPNVDEVRLKTLEERRKLLGNLTGKGSEGMVGRTIGYLVEVRAFLRQLQSHMRREKLTPENPKLRNLADIGFPEPSSLKSDGRNWLKNVGIPLLKKATPIAKALDLDLPATKAKAKDISTWYRRFYDLLSNVLSFPPPISVRDGKLAKLVKRVGGLGVINFKSGKEPKGKKVSTSELREYYKEWYKFVVYPVLDIIAASLKPEKMKAQIGSIYFY